MANRRYHRKKRRNPLGAVIIVLFAAAIMCVMAVCLMKLDITGLRRYPVEYVNEIQLRAAENAVPAPYIASIIMTESSYNPQAVSSVGARGLMQIMPDTGEWIAGKFDDTFDADMLFMPEYSIKYGAWYLGFLMDRYSGDMRCATAAYHAGQGTVDKWLKDPECSQDGLTLSYIPSDATRTYVDRVMKYYEYYAKAYEEIEIE